MRSNRARPTRFEPFAPYAAQRLRDDRHLWGTALLDELVELGYAGSYPSFTRALRTRGLRPTCPDCAAGRHQDDAVIDHRRVGGASSGRQGGATAG